MLLKRKSDTGVIENVRYVNGTVSFSKVSLNVFCYETDGLLIDTGAQRILPHFKHFFNTMDVDQVVITHDHEDHTGGAHYIHKKFGHPIYMNEIVQDETVKKANYPLYRKVFWGSRKPFPVQPIEKTFQTRSSYWKVIETPGHTQDHLSFLNKQTGQLFSGDLYVNPKTKVILKNENLPQMKRSIQRVLEEDFESLFCCHAGFIKDGKSALKEKLNQLTELEEKILSMHKQGLTEKEIQEKIYTKKYPITLLSGGEWDTIHVIRSFIHD